MSSHDGSSLRPEKTAGIAAEISSWWMREKNELAGIDHEAPRQRDFHSSSRLGYPRLISLGEAMNLTLMVQARHTAN